MHRDSEVQLIYVVGPGHSGSTLLSMLLNGHSQILGLGEIDALPLFLGSGALRQWDDPMEHDIWRQIAVCFENAAGEPFTGIDVRSPLHGRRNTSEGIARWLATLEVLYSCACSVSGVSRLVDTSHDARRLLFLARSRQWDIRVIHLVRDGRAVVGSYVRKYGEFQRGLKIWGVNSIRALRARRFFRSDCWMRLRYEDLAGDPDSAIRGVCAFLGLDYEPQMLRFRTHPYFGIGGNRMRKANAHEHIRVDDRWRRELTRGQLLAFAVLGGWLNRLNGYPISTAGPRSLRTQPR